MTRRHDAGPLLPRAVELAEGGDVAGAVATLRRERTFDLQAAYAAATRRRTDGPGYARAAQLLETALLARRRRVLEGPRFVARAEVILPLYLALHLVHVAILWRSSGPAAGLVIAAAYLAGGTALVVWLRRMRRDGDPRWLPPLAEGGRADLERWSQATAAVLRGAESDGADARALLAAAREHARGLGSPLVAAAAVAAAERRVAGSELPHARGLRPLLAEARELAVSAPGVTELLGERR